MAVQGIAGYALPAVRVPGGYFAARDRYDTAFSNVLIAVFTPTGTRPNDRQFGSRLARTLFQPQTVELNAAIDYVIRETIRKHCPFIVVESVKITTVRPEVSQFELLFSIDGDITPQTRSAFVQSSKLLRLISRS